MSANRNSIRDSSSSVLETEKDQSSSSAFTSKKITQIDIDKTLSKDLSRISSQINKKSKKSFKSIGLQKTRKV